MMLQPIFADCILHGRRKSTAGKKSEKDTEDKGAQCTRAEVESEVEGEKCR